MAIDIQKGNQPVEGGEIKNPSSSNNSYASKLTERLAEVDTMKYFNPYRLKEDVEPYMGGIPIIFMTTPDMNIFEGGNVISTLKTAEPVFTEGEVFDLELLKNLEYSSGGSDSPWIKFLTNRFKGLSLKDLTAKQSEDYETYYGWKQILPGPNTDSFSADASLSVNFSESKDLEIIKFHYYWMKYIECIRFGLHTPKKSNVRRRTIDYTSSLYYFILDMDMSKILYFTKYTGIYPVNVPLSSLSPGDISSKAPLDVSITYAYQHKEEMNPSIIFDFNSVANYASRLYNYARDSNQEKINDNYYGYGRISVDDTDFKTEINFYDKKITNVEIKIMNNTNYYVKNQTGFHSSTNLSRKSYHLCFDSEVNKSNYDDAAYRQLQLQKETEANRKREELKQFMLGSPSNILKSMANGTDVEYEKYKAKQMASGEDVADYENYKKIKEYQEYCKLCLSKNQEVISYDAYQEMKQKSLENTVDTFLDYFS